ncbi:homoserine kinase [compost metagenome]
MKEIALQHGALSFGISGSGPSVIAITRDEQVAKNIAEKIQAHLKENEIESFGYVSKVNLEGPKVLN